MVVHFENPHVGGSIRWAGSPNVAEVMDDRERPPQATIFYPREHMNNHERIADIRGIEQLRG